MSGVIALGTRRSLGSKAEAAPFVGAIGLFVLTYIGMAISLFPIIVPHQLTLWEAASSPAPKLSFWSERYSCFLSF